MRHSTVPSVLVTPTDLQEAENLWIIEAQASLPGELKFSVWQQQFGLFLDEQGIWRCGGRLAKAELSFDAKHPILLNQQHHFTALVVYDAHARVKHDGVKETLGELRARYWIIRGRGFVRRLLYRCVVCRRFEGRPFAPPPPPPLPSFRVSKAPAFTYTGVDYAGPLYVKASNSASSEKVWICLYTCCVVRAIHLEVVTDMTAQAFIRAFKRFTARRGIPAKVISDNGRTFKAANNMLSSILNHPAVKDYLKGLQTHWTFNLEKAPWWGGIFERMVKSVKRCLRKTIGRERLTMDELSTAVTEVEMIVNSRPLSHVSMEDVEEPITPSHLMVGRRILSLPDGPYLEDLEDDFIQHSTLTKRLIHLNKVLDHFWKRWKTEYLLELRNAHRQPPGRGVTRPSRVGDIVVVQDSDHPRGFWKLACVERLIAGTDGKVRGAKVRIRSPNNQPYTHLQRPIQLLYPLEVNSAVESENSENSGTQPTPSKCENETDIVNETSDDHMNTDCSPTSSTDITAHSNERPRRMAARNATVINRLTLQEDDH